MSPTQGKKRRARQNPQQKDRRFAEAKRTIKSDEEELDYQLSDPDLLDQLSIDIPNVR